MTRPSRVEPVPAGAAAARPARANPEWSETARAWLAMGTLIEVRVPDLPPRDAVEAIRRVRRRVEALEAAMTLYREESPLVAFNRAAPGAWFPVPPALAAGVAAALRGARESGGAYDPSVGAVMRAWGLHDLSGGEPDPRTRRAWRRRADWRAVEVDEPNARLRRHDPGVELDLGGVGKGIAVDAALETLAAAGSRSALVNLGGSIGVLGPPPGRGGWPVAIAHPRRRGAVWGGLLLARGHLATSGDAERRVAAVGGGRHHLLDPLTCESTRGVASVTAWAATGEQADLDSTALAVRLSRDSGTVGASAFLAVLETDAGLRGLTLWSGSTPPWTGGSVAGTGRTDARPGAGKRLRGNAVEEPVAVAAAVGVQLAMPEGAAFTPGGTGGEGALP